MCLRDCRPRAYYRCFFSRWRAVGPVAILPSPSKTPPCRSADECRRGVFFRPKRKRLYKRRPRLSFASERLKAKTMIEIRQFSRQAYVYGHRRPSEASRIHVYEAARFYESRRFETFEGFAEKLVAIATARTAKPSPERERAFRLAAVLRGGRGRKGILPSVWPVQEPCSRLPTSELQEMDREKKRF